MSQVSAGARSSGNRMGAPRQAPAQAAPKPAAVGLSRDKSPAHPGPPAPLKQSQRALPGKSGGLSSDAPGASQAREGPSSSGAQDFKQQLQVLTAQTRQMIDKNAGQGPNAGDSDGKDEGETDSMEVDEVRGRGNVNPSTAFDRKPGAPKPSLPPLQLADGADGENARLPLRLRKEIDKMLDQKVVEMKHAVAQKLHNIHLDLIRQMIQQESQVEDCLQAVASRNREQKEIIKQLKQENEKLR